jgi:LPS-assembly lipoprotein
MLLPEAGMRSSDERVEIVRGGIRRPAVLFAFLLAAVLTGGCGNGGFQPLYASSGVGGAAVNEKLAQVDVAHIPGRVGQRIRNELIFQATGGGAALPPTMRLEVIIRENVTSTLVRIDGDADAQIYSLDASFQLVRIADGSVLLTGTSYSRAGFERFSSIFSNVRARQNAEDRASKAVGDDLKARLSAFLSSAA